MNLKQTLKSQIHQFCIAYIEYFVSELIKFFLRNVLRKIYRFLKDVSVLLYSVLIRTSYYLSQSFEHHSYITRVILISDCNVKSRLNENIPT